VAPPPVNRSIKIIRMTPIPQDFVLYIFLGGLIAFNYVIKNEKRLREKDEEIKKVISKKRKGSSYHLKL
jgi:hypothetical protein